MGQERTWIKGRRNLLEEIQWWRWRVHCNQIQRPNLEPAIFVYHFADLHQADLYVCTNKSIADHVYENQAFWNRHQTSHLLPPAPITYQARQQANHC